MQEDQVLIIGNPNVNQMRSGGIASVKGNKIVAGGYAGQGRAEVTKMVPDLVWDNMDQHKLVVVAASLNILSKGNVNIQFQMERGVKEVRNRSENKTEAVHCTIPMVQKQHVSTEQRILAVNQGISSLGNMMGLVVFDVNKSLV